MAFPSLRHTLIYVALILASVQIVSADFYVNTDYINAHAYALGQVRFPYQGRVLMVPLLHWAGQSTVMQAAATRYEQMIGSGAMVREPMTPEKFISMLAGIAAMLAMVAGAARYGVRRLGSMWWLAPCLTLWIVAVTLDLHTERSVWYPYDLPHAALFGLAVIAALERRWWIALLLYAVDVPLCETAILSLPILLPLFWLNGDRMRASLLQRRAWRLAVASPRTAWTAGLAVAMVLYWAGVQTAIHLHYAGQATETGNRLARNLHELVRPNHWSQMFSAGGYLVPFLWMGRRFLPVAMRTVLLGSLVCAPIALYFGIWTETRVWLEWSLPFALVAAEACLGAFGSPQERNASPGDTAFASPIPSSFKGERHA